MKRILITGGCGFIGSHLAIALARSGQWNVVCFDNLLRRGSELLRWRVLDAGCAFAHGDIRNPEDLERLPGDFDALVECSAEPSVLVGTDSRDAPYLVRNNLNGALHCFEFARQRRCGVLFLSTSRIYPYSYVGSARFREEATRFVYDDCLPGISSEGVAVECPLQGARSLYGATKLAAEYVLQEYALNYHLPALIDRCGVIAGPWQFGKADQGVFSFWVAAHHYARPLRYIGFGGRGKQVRDLLHVDDLVALLCKQLAALSSFRGEVFNAGGGPGISLSLCEATEICREVTGNRVRIDSVLENRPGDLCWFITDNGRTCGTFGWQPVKSPREILADIHDWLRCDGGQVGRILNA